MERVSGAQIVPSHKTKLADSIVAVGQNTREWIVNVLSLHTTGPGLDAINATMTHEFGPHHVVAAHVPARQFRICGGSGRYITRTVCTKCGRVVNRGNQLLKKPCVDSKAP
jgi:hypothetical protein